MELCIQVFGDTVLSRRVADLMSGWRNIFWKAPFGYLESCTVVLDVDGVG